MYGKNLFLELLLEKLSIILQDYMIRHISGWTQLISLIVCTSADYQKRKTSNISHKVAGHAQVLPLHMSLEAAVSPHTFHRATTHC